MPPHQEWHHIVRLSHLRLVKHLLLLRLVEVPSRLCLVEVPWLLCLVEVPFRLCLMEVLLLLRLVELLFHHYLVEDLLSLHPARALLFHRSVELLVLQTLVIGLFQILASHLLGLLAYGTGRLIHPCLNAIRRVCTRFQ